MITILSSDYNEQAEWEREDVERGWIVLQERERAEAVRFGIYEEEEE